MSDCYIVRHGGGGAGLNFRVLGGTSRPTAPKENDIWVNTPNKITGWAFSKEEPLFKAEGNVWITVGINSRVSMNCIKKNILMAYPMTAYQWLGARWVLKEALSYQGGEWKEWVTYIYNQGVYNPGDLLISGNDSGSNTAIGTETMRINVATQGRSSWIATTKKIDFTNISSANLNVTSFGGGNEQREFVLTLCSKNLDIRYDDVYKYSAAHTVIKKSGLITLDTSFVSGEHYLVVGGFSSFALTIEADELWLA